MGRGLERAEALVKREQAYHHLHSLECHRIKRFLQNKKNLRLNLGCGPHIRAGWCNVDLSAIGADFWLDLREPWPFSSESAQTVYCEHFFEHLEWPEETDTFLNEASRVLQPGGTIHIGVPGTEWVMRAYGRASDWYWKFAPLLWHPKTCVTQMDHVNYHFRQEGEHKYAWDRETLTGELQKHGFANAVRRRWRPELDSESRRINTLYIVARKGSRLP